MASLGFEVQYTHSNDLASWWCQWLLQSTIHIRVWWEKWTPCIHMSLWFNRFILEGKLLSVCCAGGSAHLHRQRVGDDTDEDHRRRVATALHFRCTAWFLANLCTEFDVAHEGWIAGYCSPKAATRETTKFLTNVGGGIFFPFWIRRSESTHSWCSGKFKNSMGRVDQIKLNFGIRIIMASSCQQTQAHI